MLHAAIAAGDMDAVKAALTERNVNQSIGGWAALHCSVFSNEPDIAKYLCEQGANVNSTGETKENVENVTPLMIAAARNRVAIAEILLEHGADASLVDANGHDAMHRAIESQDNDMVRLLERYQSSDRALRTAEAVAQQARILYEGEDGEHVSLSDYGVYITRDGRFGVMGWYTDDMGWHTNVFEIPTGRRIWGIEHHVFYGIAEGGNAIYTFDFDTKSFCRRECNGATSPILVSKQIQTRLDDDDTHARGNTRFSHSGRYAMELIERLRLVDTNTGKSLASFSNGTFVFSSDERFLLVSDDWSVAFYELLPGKDRPEGSRWSQIWRSLTERKIVRRWSRSIGGSGTVKLDPHNRLGLFLTSKRDSNHITDQETLLLLDMESGETVQELEIEKGRLIGEIGFLANGRVAFAMGFPYANHVNVDDSKCRGITLWDLSGTVNKRGVWFRGWTRAPYPEQGPTVAISADANHLLCAAYNITYVPVSWDNLAPLFGE